MDNSRDRDLALLYERFNDRSKTRFFRRQAHKAFVSVQDQITDRGLTKLRYSLVKAMRTGDADAAHKIEQRIKEHTAKR